MSRADIDARRRGGSGAAPDRRAPGGAGPAPHRRDQARLAVRRADRGRRRGHRRPGPGLRGRRRGGDLGAVRAALVRRLGRRPARRSGPRSRSRSWPRTSSSTRVQLPLLRAAGADLVLLLAVLHPARRLARLVERALALGLEPLVEVHDAARARRGRSPREARLIGLNNRDLRTLEVDVERAGRLRDLVPDDRLVIAESGVREPPDRRPLARARVRRRARRRGARASRRPGRRRPRLRRRRRRRPTTRPTSRAARS